MELRKVKGVPSRKPGSKRMMFEVETEEGPNLPLFLNDFEVETLIEEEYKKIATAILTGTGESVSKKLQRHTSKIVELATFREKFDECKAIWED